MVFYATTCSARSTSKILWSLIPSAGFENVKRFIPFPTFSLDLDRACASVSREAILSRQRLVKNFTFGTCIFTHVSHWLTWRARPLRDGQKGNKKHLSCNIAAEGVEKRCCAFYHPYQTCVATNQVVNRFDWRGSWNGQHRFLTCSVQQCKTSYTFLCAFLTFSCAFIPLFPSPSTVCHEGPEVEVEGWGKLNGHVTRFTTHIKISNLSFDSFSLLFISPFPYPFKFSI